MLESPVRPPLFESTIKSLPLLGRGKVRDIYAVGEDNLLIVTTDRLSAFDVILPDPIPGKGEILTAMSLFWFRHFEDTVPHHLSRLSLEEVLPDPVERAQVEGRAMVVKRLLLLLCVLGVCIEGVRSCLYRCGCHFCVICSAQNGDVQRGYGCNFRST